MTDTTIQKTIELNGQWPAIGQVADATELSKQTIEQAAEKGAVWLRAGQGSSQFKKPRRVRLLDDKFKSRDQILINYDSKVLAAEPPAVELICDQVNYSVWYKPHGVLSQGTKWGDHCSMCYLVEKAHGKPAHLVHRLDRAASGLMILAHTKNALVKLTELFASRKVEKTYQVRVRGSLAEKLPKQIRAQVEGKSALTTILSAEVAQSQGCDSAPGKPESESNSGGTESVLTVNIESGRKHQIRSHLSGIGLPVVGDRLFSPDRRHRRDLQLVSVALELQCPFTAKTVSVQLPERLNTVSPGK